MGGACARDKSTGTDTKKAGPSLDGGGTLLMALDIEIQKFDLRGGAGKEVSKTSPKATRSYLR